MLEKLIKEFEAVSLALENVSGDESLDTIFYLQGKRQGILDSMNIIDFKGTGDYFQNSDDLPY